MVLTHPKELDCQWKYVAYFYKQYLIVFKLSLAYIQIFLKFQIFAYFCLASVVAKLLAILKLYTK